MSGRFAPLSRVKHRERQSLGTVEYIVYWVRWDDGAAAHGWLAEHDLEPAPPLNPGDCVEHESVPGEFGQALIRQVVGSPHIKPYARWLVLWDNQRDEMSPTAHWHTEDTLVAVSRSYEE